MKKEHVMCNIKTIVVAQRSSFMYTIQVFHRLHNDRYNTEGINGSVGSNERHTTVKKSLQNPHINNEIDV